jgi:hypothetical protein
VFHLALVMCWTVRLFYNLFCDSAASLRVCCHFNILSTFQLLQNTFIICHTSLASSLLAYFEPFLFSCEETKYFITDINIVLHRFCILQECFSQCLGDVSDGFFCGFLKILEWIKWRMLQRMMWSFGLPLWEFKWTKNITVCHWSDSPQFFDICKNICLVL